MNAGMLLRFVYCLDNLLKDFLCHIETFSGLRYFVWEICSGGSCAVRRVTHWYISIGSHRDCVTARSNATVAFYELFRNKIITNFHLDSHFPVCPTMVSLRGTQ